MFLLLSDLFIGDLALFNKNHGLFFWPFASPFFFLELTTTIGVRELPRRPAVSSQRWPRRPVDTVLHLFVQDGISSLAPCSRANG